MNGKLLLDTNAVIAVFAGDASALAVVSPADECFISSIVLGELFYGARHSSRMTDNLNRIQKFCDATTVLSCDAGTASEYGTVKSQLRAKGRPIPENDVWIAAVAVQYGIPLLSCDQHFDDVPGLRRIQW